MQQVQHCGLVFRLQQVVANIVEQHCHYCYSYWAFSLFFMHSCDFLSYFTATVDQLLKISLFPTIVRELALANTMCNFQRKQSAIFLIDPQRKRKKCSLIQTEKQFRQKASKIVSKTEIFKHALYENFFKLHQYRDRYRDYINKTCDKSENISFKIFITEISTLLHIQNDSFFIFLYHSYTIFYTLFAANDLQFLRTFSDWFRTLPIRVIRITISGYSGDEA